MPSFKQPVEPLGGLHGPHLLESCISAEYAPEFTSAIWYHPIARIWIAGGRSPSMSKAIAFYTLGTSGASRWQPHGSDSGINSLFVCNCIDNSSHLVAGNLGIRIGGTLSSGSTASKVYYSTDLGLNWTAVSIGASNSTEVRNLGYENTLGHLGTVGNTIYRTTSIAGPYSSVQAMTGTIRKNGLAIRPTSANRAAMAAVIDNTTTARYSLNGTSWSTDTLPSAFDSIEWSNHRKTFVGLTTAGAIYETPDLATEAWTLTSSGPFTKVATFGSYLVAYTTSSERFLYSLNGVSWTPMFYSGPDVPDPTLQMHAAQRDTSEFPHQLGITVSGLSLPNSHILTASG